MTFTFAFHPASERPMYQVLAAVENALSLWFYDGMSLPDATAKVKTDVVDVAIASGQLPADSLSLVMLSDRIAQVHRRHVASAWDDAVSYAESNTGEGGDVPWLAQGSSYKTLIGKVLDEYVEMQAGRPALPPPTLAELDSSPGGLIGQRVACHMLRRFIDRQTIQQNDARRLIINDFRRNVTTMAYVQRKHCGEGVSSVGMCDAIRMMAIALHHAWGALHKMPKNNTDVWTELPEAYGSLLSRSPTVCVEFWVSAVELWATEI